MYTPLPNIWDAHKPKLRIDEHVRLPTAHGRVPIWASRLLNCEQGPQTQVEEVTEGEDDGDAEVVCVRGVWDGETDIDAELDTVIEGEVESSAEVDEDTETEVDTVEDPENEVVIDVDAETDDECEIVPV